MLRFSRYLFYALLWGACAVILLGFLGRFHPIGDTMSLLRLPLGALCLISVFFALPVLLRSAVGIAAVATILTTLPPWFDSRDGGEVAVYSKNLWFANAEIPALAEDIVASGAELVLLQELSDRNEQLLSLLAAQFPYQHSCRPTAWSGIAVLSAYPFVGDPQCSSRRAMALAEIDRDGEPFWAASVHLTWPYPYNHENALQSALRLLEPVSGPIVMGGDFNIFPWASSVAALKAQTGTQLAGPIWPTYYLHHIPLLLDQIYAPGGGFAETRPPLGSDHLGVLAHIHLAR